jgi:hypothetical protein
MSTQRIISVLFLTLFTGYAAAQNPPADTLKVDYFANAHTTNAPDATVRITNPGTSGGDLCAAIYVFDPMQELSECCSCLVTPDGLRTLSVNTDLTGNPLTGVILTTGTIEILSIQPTGGSCPLPTKPTPAVAGIRAWSTHIQDSAFTITESASQDATLSAWEQRNLQRQCYAISLIGSGGGICTCGTGD